jgi:hypothetical protein
MPSRKRHLIGEEPRGVEPLIPETLSLSCDFRLHPSHDAVLDRFSRNFSEERSAKAERLEAMNVEVVLSPSQALRGGEVRIGVPTFKPCTTCHGVAPAHCATCAGTGLVELERVVCIEIPPRAADRSVLEVELTDLGVKNFYLRAIVRIDPSVDA